jgi:hypothetical protein
MIQETGQVPPPNARFELAEGVCEDTSAAAVIVREYELWQYLSDPTSARNNPQAKMKFVDEWIQALPEMYSTSRRGAVGDGDVFADRFRRTKLHCMGYMALLAYLRPHLSPGTEPESAALCDLAVQVAIHLMRISKEFLALCYPTHAKYFLVQFCPFDTASTLCSSLLRDAARTWIPRRMEVVEGIGCALHISDRLRNLSKMGDATWNILTTMAAQLDLTGVEREVLERSRRTGDVGYTGETPELGVEETGPMDALGEFSHTDEPFSPMGSIGGFLMSSDPGLDSFMGMAADEHQTIAHAASGKAGVGYNISGIMALEEEMNSNALDADWSWAELGS